MTSDLPAFCRLTPIERAFNRAFGFLIRLGFGLPHNYLPEVRGRNTGRIHATPVDLPEFEGGRFLVAGRGRTPWVRNAEVAGEVTLAKGRIRQTFPLRPAPAEEKPELLKAYLDRFKLTVQRYLPVPAGSAPQAFVDLARHYSASSSSTPVSCNGQFAVFELLPPRTGGERPSEHQPPVLPSFGPSVRRTEGRPARGLP